MAKYTPSPDCMAQAKEASGDKLTKDEIESAFQKVHDYKQKLQASGQIDGLADKVRTFAEREAERAKIVAAMQKRHAALNILARDRLDEHISTLMSGKRGLSPKKALLAVLEGTQKGIEGGRNSVAALSNAYEARYIGGMMAEIQQRVPHMVHVLRDQSMDHDIMREMGELRDGGKPGITGNKDAQVIAEVFGKYAELSRTDLNKLGASVGKLDGWAGPQSHDDMKMIEAGKDAWVDAVTPHLDIDRTFPDLADLKEVKEALGDIYDTLITGFPNKPTPKEMGQRVNPANLAKSLGKSRVLHFKDANAALDYRDKFGYGNTVSGMIGHLRRSAKVAANMDALGPNPEIMFSAIAESMKRKIKESTTIPDAEKQKQIQSLTTDAGALRQALDISTGLVSRPVNTTGAKIGSDLRAIQAMAKLGGSVLSSINDTITPAVASQFRGSGFMRGLMTQLDGLRRGRPKGQQAEISYILGEGFDGLIGHIVSPAAANDGPIGFLSKIQEAFFRWNGQSWWTDVNRAAAGRMIAAEMGMRAQTAFKDLPANYSHVLGLHSIGEKEWNVIREAAPELVEGNRYITPDAIRNLSDEAISPLVEKRLAGKSEEQQTAILDKARKDLELSVLRFVADETNYGVLEPDARTRRTLTLGTRPGTIAGEGIRFIAQFKGFPIAFGQRVLGRALFGHRQGAGYLERASHIGTLLAGLTMAGYMSMTLKDMARGYWPPRDPTDPKTWGAAFVQGGAAGIYGDYLFSRVNRFGGGPLETAAGPTIGATADLVNLFLKARQSALSGDDQAKMSDFITFGLQNTPFINMFYTRTALDFLFLNSMREVATPGYNRKIESRRKTEYGQTNYAPDYVKAFGR
jgi:hypothetical protein